MKYSREETEIKKEILFRMYERGFEYKDMADIVGISCGTAYLWIREERKHQKMEREECVKNRVKGWNADTTARLQDLHIQTQSWKRVRLLRTDRPCARMRSGRLLSVHGR